MKREIATAVPYSDPVVAEAIGYLRENAAPEVFETLDLEQPRLIRVDANRSVIIRFFDKTDRNQSVTVVKNDKGLTGNRVSILNNTGLQETVLKSGSLDGRTKTEVLIKKDSIVKIESKVDGRLKTLRAKKGFGNLFVDENEALTQKRNPDDDEGDETTELWLPDYVVVGYSLKDPTPFASLFWLTDMNQLYLRSYAPAILIQTPTGGPGIQLKADAQAVELEVFQFDGIGGKVKVKQLMDCFGGIADAGAKYAITLHTDIPVDNNPKELLNGLSPGHTFLSFTKSNGSQSITQVFGFYPNASTLTVFNVGVEAITLDDGRHEYNSSISMVGIDKSQFDLASKTAENYSETRDYDLNDFNCTNYALEVFNSIRQNDDKIEVPDWHSQFINLNFGTTPNGLYEVLKKMKLDNGKESGNINVGKFSAGSSKGPCK